MAPAGPHGRGRGCVCVCVCVCARADYLDQNASSAEKPTRSAGGLLHEAARGMVPARPSSADTGRVAAVLQ